MRTLWLIASIGLAAPALGQETADPPQPAAGIDEVIVPGSRPENLRVEIERVEAAVYERWNALNSKDEFDIQCRKLEPTGSNIPVRTCVPKFVIEAESRATREASRGVSRADNFASDAAVTMAQKSSELTEEMQRLAREDEQFLRDLTRLDELKQLEATQGETRRESRRGSR
jgi:hypothetical protein